MNVAVIGSRSFNDYTLLKHHLDTLKISYIISGGAIGADSLGEKYAIEHNIKTIIFLPNWNKYGKSAGFIRNKDIVNTADIIVAFWDGKSKGTAHSIKYAQQTHKELIIVKF